MRLIELREDQALRAEDEGNDQDRAWLLSNVRQIDECNRRIAELEAALRMWRDHCTVSDAGLGAFLEVPAHQIIALIGEKPERT